MKISDSGGVLKNCEKCGKLLHIENWYAAIRQKYCKECAAISKNEQIAGYMKKSRQKARERRQLEREQNKLLIDENELLRQQVRELRNTVEIEREKVKALER